MNLEEAIKNREDCLKYLERIGQKAIPDCVEAVRWSAKALKALRPVSREQVEKIRGEWAQNRNAIIDSIMYSKCGAIYQAYYGGYPYCPRCGAPMTDEAVQMVMERLEALRGETETD